MSLPGNFLLQFVESFLCLLRRCVRNRVGVGASRLIRIRIRSRSGRRRRRAPSRLKGVYRPAKSARGGRRSEILKLRRNCLTGALKRGGEIFQCSQGCLDIAALSGP